MAARQQTLVKFTQPSINFRWGIICSISLLTLSALIPVLQASLITTQGHDIQLLKQNRSQITAELRLIESELAELNSLERIERRAREIGLIDPPTLPIFIEIPSHLISVTKTTEQLPGQEKQTLEPTPWWRSILVQTNTN